MAFELPLEGGAAPDLSVPPGPLAASSYLAHPGPPRWQLGGLSRGWEAPGGLGPRREGSSFAGRHTPCQAACGQVLSQV